jgi:hypothetical protein
LMTLTRSAYDTASWGEAVDQFYVANSRGLSFRLITYNTRPRSPARKEAKSPSLTSLPSLTSSEAPR